MRMFASILIIILSISTIFFYLQNRQLKQTHELIINNMEDKLNLADEECRTRIARIRNHYESQLAKSQTRAAQREPTGLLQIFANIKEKAHNKREESIARAKTELGLHENTFAQFVKIMEGYADKRSQVLALSQSEKKPFFDQRYLDMLKKHQHKALDSLENILDDEQMRNLRDSGLAQSLGLLPLNEQNGQSSAGQ